MKKYFLHFAEVVIFVILLLAILFRVSLFEKTFGKGFDNGRNSTLFYELPKDTVDIMFVGDSHIYQSFIPQLIYDQAGFTSAEIATANQSVLNTYWCIKESLERQNPEVIVIDMHSIECDSKKSNNYLHLSSGILALPDYSLNKYRCYKDIKEANYKLSNDFTFMEAIGLFQYRNDYDRKGDIKEAFNLLFNPIKEYKTFGYNVTTEIYDVGDELDEGISDKADTFKNSIANIYMNKILSLCNDNNIEMILTRNLYSSQTANINTYKEIKNWAILNNVTVVDYFEIKDKVDFDIKTDFCDSTHLNYNGAKKATNYLIQILKNNHNLVDHRGERKYKLWEKADFDYNLIEKEMHENIERIKK